MKQHMNDKARCCNVHMLKQACVMTPHGENKLTRPVLLSQCTPSSEVHCWRATGGQPETTQEVNTVQCSNSV